MKNEIENHLNSLIGKPLISVSRAASMQMFGFGNWVDALAGEARKVGEYALHIQCAWRITSEDKIFVAQGDMFYPKGDYETESGDFDWDVSGNNICDERTSELIQQNIDVPFVVNELYADKFGSLKLKFSRNFSLEIFPNHSMPEEFWRFLKLGTNENHFVVYGNGIEFE